MCRLAAALVTACALSAAFPLNARSDDGAPEGPFGVVHCDAKGVTYQLTPDDVLWAGRMLVGEAGGRDDVDSAGVLWSMLNSYAIRPVRDSYPTFASFVRAYCTPLQPWLKSEGAVRRHRKRGTPMEEVEPGRFQLVRHLALQRRSWKDLPRGARALALRVLRGGQPSVCGNATQFCSTAIYYRDRHDRRPNAEEHAAFTRAFAEEKRWSWVVPPGSQVMKNCFFEELRYAKLPRPAVTVTPSRARPPR